MDLTLQQVKDKFTFLKIGDYEPVTQEFTSIQEDTIRGYIDYLYGSPEARKIFNQIKEPVQILAYSDFGGLKNFGGDIFTPKPLVTFDMKVFSGEFKRGYISETGEFVEYDVRLAFIHELIHAITGLTDNEGKRGFSSRADSAGPTQDVANKIHDELKAPIRVSYDGSEKIHEPGENPVNTSIEKGTQFTKGKIVDVIDNQVDIGAFVIKDVDTSSNSPATNDLLLYRGSSNRTFITGNGNDYLYGGSGNDTLNSGGDKDYLNGGKRNDSLEGGTGEDLAEFSDDFKNYDVGDNNDGSITITHENNGIDGIDTLKNIEWGIFKGESVPIGTSRLAASATASTPAPRIIPLPLEDGVIETKSVKAVDTTPSPNINDLPTPPQVALSMPKAMLDGNVDYTLNISPYKPDTQYNILYFLDTSSSISTSKLQQAKDAYINLTNYFVDNGLAENTNFGIVTFNNSAILQTDPQGDRNLTANEAIASIQNLIVTTSDSRDDNWIDRNFTAAEAIASIQNLIATTGIGRDDDWIDRNFTAAEAIAKI